MGSDALTYDDNGNLTDEGAWGAGYEYVYDVFNRLKAVKNSSHNVVAEYRYNGLGYRIGWHYDSGRMSLDVPPVFCSLPDGTVDGDDPWFSFCYDEKWRVVAMFRADDGAPKEQFYYNAAGLGGTGGSSYIDSVILRDRDSLNDDPPGGTELCHVDWSAEPADTLDERRYLCQNWRADVSSVITDTGRMRQWTKYSAYGTPIGLPFADLNGDGEIDASGGYQDTVEIQKLEGQDGNDADYDVRADVDLDGHIDSSDTAAATAASGLALGRAVLSWEGVRKGYAGYEGFGNGMDGMWHVRHRVLHSTLGRWVQRQAKARGQTFTSSAHHFARAAAANDASGSTSGRATASQLDWTVSGMAIFSEQDDSTQPAWKACVDTSSSYSACSDCCSGQFPQGEALDFEPWLSCTFACLNKHPRLELSPDVFKPDQDFDPIRYPLPPGDYESPINWNPQPIKPSTIPDLKLPGGCVLKFDTFCSPPTPYDYEPKCYYGFRLECPLPSR